MAFAGGRVTGRRDRTRLTVHFGSSGSGRKIRTPGKKLRPRPGRSGTPPPRSRARPSLAIAPQAADASAPVLGVALPLVCGDGLGSYPLEALLAKEVLDTVRGSAGVDVFAARAPRLLPAGTLRAWT